MIPKHHWDQHINDENYKQRIWYVYAEQSVRAPNMRVESGRKSQRFESQFRKLETTFLLRTAKMLWFCCRNWPLYARNHYICFICRSLSIVHVIWSQQLNFESSSTLEMIQTEIPFRLYFFFIEKNWKHLKKTQKVSSNFSFKNTKLFPFKDSIFLSKKMSKSVKLIIERLCIIIAEFN